MDSGRHWEHPRLEPGPSAREAGGIGWGQVCWRDLLLVLGGGLTKASGVPGAGICWSGPACHASRLHPL